MRPRAIGSIGGGRGKDPAGKPDSSPEQPTVKCPRCKTDQEADRRGKPVEHYRKLRGTSYPTKCE